MSVLLVGAVVWVGVRAVLVKDELESMMELMGPVGEAADARDVDRLEQLVGRVHTHSAHAQSLTGDPVWRLAEAVPMLGPNMTAVRLVSHSLAEMSRTGQPLLELASATASDSTVSSVKLLAQAREPLRDAADAFTRADGDLRAVPGDDLIDQVTEGVTAIRSFTRAAVPLVTTLAQSADVLPRALGADQPRTILVMLQNSAELRTAGGVAGSFVLLRSDGGEITVVDQADSSSFEGRSKPVIEASDPSGELYGDVFERYVQNISMTPDFALTGELASAWWEEYSGEAPDLVLSLDVPAVAALLTSDPLVLADGSELASEDLVQKLLVDSYFELDRDAQTEFHRVVVGAAISRALTQGADPISWAERLMSPLRDGRISLWSPDPGEQAVIAGTEFGGPSSRLASAGDAAYAVWLNDATTGKMSSNLDVDIQAGEVMCRSDGRAEISIAVTLTNTAPPTAADWPWWVTGGGIEGVPPGHIATDVTAAAPRTAFFGGVTVDGEIVPSVEAEDDTYAASRARITVAPGESSAVEFRFIAEDAHASSPTVLHTPLMRELVVSDYTPTCR